ncbi:GntR family transcriptional regulator [Bosea sp. CCNWLW174]|uniref:GntR family transcriptional regulator n=1 Tax=unclassified Bosea (in: a-proteobacteria) TaxID=2653178 RepID=UPI003014AFB1
MSDSKTSARYLQIVNVLQARLNSGLYPVGTLLPTEAELCQEFDVSRYTIREALRRLMAMGLVSRRQGSGTMVQRTEPSQGYFFALNSLTDLFQYSLDTYFQIVGIDETTLDTATAEAVDGKRGARWMVVTGLRSVSEGEKPFSLTKSYIPHRLAWIVPELPGCVGPFYAHIEKRANEPIIKAQQQISAVRMPQDVLQALGPLTDELSLLLLRRYVSKKGTLVASFNWHIASEFTYRMEIQRDRA